jgi:predicted CoA-binding protein
MITPELINEFLSLPSIAVIGASQNEKRFGHSVYKALKSKSFKVFPVNPKYSKIGDDICYTDIKSLPEKVEGAIIITSPKNTNKLINDVILSGIKYLWIQQGCETPQSVELAKANNIRVISKKCILMFAEPVTGFHKFHRTINNFFGKLYF